MELREAVSRALLHLSEEDPFISPKFKEFMKDFLKKNGNEEFYGFEDNKTLCADFIAEVVTY